MVGVIVRAIIQLDCQPDATRRTRIGEQPMGEYW